MKIAVVGATGNAGTGVLRALRETPEVEKIVAIARREPAAGLEPYADAEFHSIDIAAASDAEDAITALAEAFEGVDTVIHLAWLIQPNTKRDLLRRVNVEGTRRVTEAVARSGVRHLVCASSVGAYSPDDARSEHAEPVFRDETFPTDGIESSHYSVDKAAQERVLDEFEQAHPEVGVTRLRPGLIFQADAASEIKRYFLGQNFPQGLLPIGSLPTVPLPKGLKLQAVHARDIGAAYALAATKQVPGAFNICADDVLRAEQVAEIVGQGPFVELPPALFRAGLLAANKSGLTPTDVGWLDMGMNVPVMDNAKAKQELGWQPTVSAADTLRELLDAMVAGEGHPSPLLRAEEKDTQPVAVGATAAQRDEAAAEPAGHPVELDLDLVRIYVSDHLAGAQGGTARANRMKQDFIDTPVFSQLAALADQMLEERNLLEDVNAYLGAPQTAVKRAAAWAGEKAGRLKLNGRVQQRSPLTLLVEVDAMRGAVATKQGLWQSLREHAVSLGLQPETFDELISLSAQQLDSLDGVHAYARRTAFLG